MILPRALYNESPPERRTRGANNPTLLYSWWCTVFSFVLIIFRLGGRYVRNERLFREDKIMALSIIPLFARMVFVHVILIYGTNNVDTNGLVDPIQIHHREIGAKLVLAARIFYALFIWTAKFTVSEFLKRLTERFWKKGYEYCLRAIRVFLVATFIAAVIATLAECQPFSHYWQVIPDPGPQCRQGYAHLLTMGITDIITDILLVLFPIPIIVKSNMPLKRKLSLVALFSMAVILIVITGSRMPLVIKRRGVQQFRTVFASSEILAATIVSNAIVLGSFLRDRGIKKPKFKSGSATDSMDRRSSTRRPTLQELGSDENLARSLGYRMNSEDAENKKVIARPAPVANLNLLTPSRPPPFSGNNWQFPKRKSGSSQPSGDPDLKADPTEDPLPSPRGGRRVSFFDVGGLLEAGSHPSASASPTDTVTTHDFATQPRRGSRASSSLLTNGRTSLPLTRRSSRMSSQSEDYELSLRPSQQLEDLGGLLCESHEIAIEEEEDNWPFPSPTSNATRQPRNTPAVRGLQTLQDAGSLLSFST